MTGRLVLWLTRAAIIAVSVGAVLGGCSRQSEGERCDRAAAGDTDCNEGLVCVRCRDLESGQIHCCCPPTPGAEVSGSCQRADSERPASACSPATGGSGGSGDSGSDSGGAAQ